QRAGPSPGFLPGAMDSSAVLICRSHRAPPPTGAGQTATRAAFKPGAALSGIGGQGTKLGTVHSRTTSNLKLRLQAFKLWIPRLRLGDGRLLILPSPRRGGT